MKEEGDSSHVNQAYDKSIAKSQASAVETLSMLCWIKMNKGVADHLVYSAWRRHCQRGGFHLSIHATWIWKPRLLSKNGAKRSNPFCMPVKKHLSCRQLRRRMSVFSSLLYGMGCFWRRKKLGQDCRWRERIHHSLSEEAALWVQHSICWVAAHLCRVWVDERTPRTSQLRCAQVNCSHIGYRAIPEEAKQVISRTAQVTENLDLFTLKPPRLKGMELFDHMVHCQLIWSSSAPILPATSLDCHVYCGKKVNTFSSINWF